MEITKENKEFLTNLLNELGSCDGFIKAVNEKNTISELAQYFKIRSMSIADFLGYEEEWTIEYDITITKSNPTQPTPPKS